MNRPKMALAILVLFASLSPCADAQIYTYVWQPRSTDVGVSDSKDYQLLNALLTLSKPQNYNIQAGDSLDFIIRKRFLVSSQFPHAYGLYVKRVLQLNPDLTTATVLHPNQPMQLPGGPKFSASELSDLPLSAGTQQAQFSSLSQKAYETYTVETSHISKFATRTLSAFVLSQPKSSSDAAFKMIQERGLVAAIDLAIHPQSELAQAQAIDLYRTDEASDSALSAVKAIDPTHTLTGTLPMSASVTVTCPKCLQCQELLKLPPGLDLSKARVLIEDTGIDTSLVDQSMIIPQTPDPSAPLAVLNPADQSADKHGTFVFSQIAANSGANPAGLNKGLIPQPQIYVAKVALPQSDGSQRYSMSDILAGWRTFEARISKDKTAAQTWVVNLSMFGEDTDSGDVTPSPPRSDHLLIVAAAGNEGSPTEPPLIAFSRLSGPGTPLLIVGALTTSDIRATYSNFDPSMVQLFARGDCVCGTPNQINGTSQATPVVATAAAVLASARPTMKPLEVMWRLISTADRDQTSSTESLGGRINMLNAMDTHILVTEDIGDGHVLPHEITDVTLTSEFLLDISGRPTNLSGKELLRLSRTVAVEQVCFDAIRELVFSTAAICMPPATQIQFIENGNRKTLAASKIKDIILPLPADRDPQISFPEVAIP